MTSFGKIIVGLIVLAVVFFVFNAFIYSQKQGEPLATDIKNLTFVLDGEMITLTDGVSEVEVAPGSASKVVTRYFGNEVKHDIDGDGDEDMVFLVTQETGGTGTFFYIVGAINTGAGYEGTQALFVGDRIAPQTTNVGNGRQVIVNYADRAAGESFDVQPSIGKSLYVLYDADSNSFGTVEPNFEGEATSKALGKSFQERMFTAGTSDGLIPIEGFDAGILLSQFPGLRAEDFGGVETFEGVYSIEDGEAVYTRTQGQPVSSAERTVSAAGYETLLINVAERMNLNVRTEFDIDRVVTELFGKGAVKLKVGETLTAAAVAINPLEVVEDSRCASDVQCVWEGTVKVRAGVNGEEVELTLGADTQVGAYSVTLAQVMPYPESDVTIEQSEYSLVFLVEKL